MKQPDFIIKEALASFLKGIYEKIRKVIKQYF